MASAEKHPTIKPGGGEAIIFNERIWAEVRTKAGMPEDFANAGWSIKDLAHGGGKGGTLMAKVGTTFIAKELSKGDHNSLLKNTEAYFKHVTTGDSIITPIYLHYQDVTTGRFFFVMQNCIGGCDSPAEMFDLKGCADDKTLIRDNKGVKAVHKRLWNVGMWCGQVHWTDDRKTYWQGKRHAANIEFDVSDSQRKWICGAIRRDCEFLAKQHLMDYSLLVAIKRGPPSVFANSSSATSGISNALRPLVRTRPDGNMEALYVGIIDILQEWTNGKRVARVLKFSECNKATVPPGNYGARFARHFDLRFKATVDESAVVHENKPQVEGTSPPVAPPAGDGDDMPKPEERLDSRKMVESADAANDQAAKGVGNTV